MNKEELAKILANHKLYRETDGKEGQRADLTETDLSKVNLRCVALSNANLVGADLRQANLVGADLSETSLLGANLLGAFLTGANLTGAKYNKDTVFSEGFNPKEREMISMDKTQEVKEVKTEQIPTRVKSDLEMTKGELDDIILKALACQIMLTEQAIYKGESLVDGIDHHELSEHLWEETAFHAQLVTLRRQELKEYQEAYAFLSKKEEELKKIDINRIRELVAELDEFNKLKLSEIEFIEDSEIIKIEPSLIEDFKSLGLSNKDFLMTDFYKTGFGSEKEDE